MNKIGNSYLEEKFEKVDKKDKFMIKRKGEGEFKKKLRKIYKQKALYLMIIPGLLLILLFRYLPIFGIVLSFKDYNFRDGMFGSPWVGFENFKFFFSSSFGINAIKNTIMLNMVFITIHTIAQVFMAIAFNEIGKKTFKKITQTMMLFPHFISWMIISVFAYNLMNFEYGTINSILRSIDIKPIDFYGMPEIWPIILVFVDLWKKLGYGMIIYLAVLTGISKTYYEAAAIDGANKFQQIRYITIPMLIPTVLILTILAIGHIMNSDFGMFFGIVGLTPQLYDKVEVLDMFVYRNLMQLGDIGMSAAAAFFQSLVGLGMLLTTNAIVKKYKSDGAIF